MVGGPFVGVCRRKPDVLFVDSVICVMYGNLTDVLFVGWHNRVTPCARSASRISARKRDLAASYSTTSCCVMESTSARSSLDRSLNACFSIFRGVSLGNIFFKVALAFWSVQLHCHGTRWLRLMAIKHIHSK